MEYIVIFSADSIRVGYLRLVIQYYADDWLFIEQYKFVIDGVAYTHIPKEVERDNGYGGYIWEWCDDWLSKEDEIFIKALANAKVAKVRYEGSQYYKEKIITAQQIKAINTAYELHKAMGGKLPLPP